jgi:hypothetical protein
MNLLDAILIILLISQALRWAQVGFARGFLSLSGFWLGLILGIIAATYVARFFDDPLLKTL